LDYTGEGWQQRVAAHPDLDREYGRLGHELIDLDEHDYSGEADVDASFAEGKIAGTEWGDLRYRVEGTDDDKHRWKLMLAVVPPGAPDDLDPFGSDAELTLDDTAVARLLKDLDAMRAAAARAAASN
jgi:hypothetical protein